MVCGQEICDFLTPGISLLPRLFKLRLCIEIVNLETGQHWAKICVVRLSVSRLDGKVEILIPFQALASTNNAVSYGNNGDIVWKFT